MPKKCSEEDCNWVVFSKGLCKLHWQRTYSKPLAKLSKKGKEKKKEKAVYTNRQFKLFLEIWDERPHLCENCETYIAEPLSVNFHHLLWKSLYPELALIKDNIIILCFSCHQQCHTDASRLPYIVSKELEIRKQLLR